MGDVDTLLNAKHDDHTLINVRDAVKEALRQPNRRNGRDIEGSEGEGAEDLSKGPAKA